MDRAQIRAEWGKFIEYPSDDKRIVTTTSALLFAEHIAKLQATQAEPVQAPGKWEGAEEWMPLAWELCADECGEEACTELVWEGGPIPEPWGDRWLKYEDEAKRLIALIRKHVPAVAVQPAQAGELPDERPPLGLRDPNVDELARVLHAAFAKAEPRHGITLYPESYWATFADMARAALAERKPSCQPDQADSDQQAGLSLTGTTQLKAEPALTDAESRWREECADTDRLLVALGLDIDKCRSEGGNLMTGRIVAWMQDRGLVPFEPQDSYQPSARKPMTDEAASDEVIELSAALERRRILEGIKAVAKIHPADDMPTPFQSAWAGCCEEIFYMATENQWHMDEDAARFNGIGLEVKP